MNPPVAIAAIAMLASTSAMAQELLEIPFSDAPVYDSFGDFDNYAELIDVNQAFGLPSGLEVIVTSIAWDLTITTRDPSILADAVIHLDDADALFPPGPDAINLVPGAADLFSGAAAYSSGGQQSLSSLGLDDLRLSKGSLYLELFDSFDDFVGEADATITGSVTLGVTLVPAPGSVALLAMGGLAVVRRRRHGGA
jgi:hypothetical protein